jgi:hypothetical protein
MTYIDLFLEMLIDVTKYEMSIVADSFSNFYVLYLMIGGVVLFGIYFTVLVPFLKKQVQNFYYGK